MHLLSRGITPFDISLRQLHIAAATLIGQSSFVAARLSTSSGCTLLASRLSLRLIDAIFIVSYKLDAAQVVRLLRYEALLRGATDCEC